MANQGVRDTLLSQLCLGQEEIVGATQSSLQANLDILRYNALLDSLSLAGIARLKALSSSNYTSGWLKAPPSTSLGLAMTPTEFIVAVRIWLGLPSFPSQPSPLLCRCGQFVDPTGDHLLGCGHGPYRIRRHDALRDIVYEALLQDNRMTRREQRICGDSLDRPGDIFHWDFNDGRATYFDVSVTNTLQPGSISLASNAAGEVGSQGERNKMKSTGRMSNQVGGCFVPLVVETLGVWIPYALKSLKKIAAYTVVRIPILWLSTCSNAPLCKLLRYFPLLLPLQPFRGAGTPFVSFILHTK